MDHLQEDPDISRDEPLIGQISIEELIAELRLG